MSKKKKVKKTLVEQILDKAGVAYQPVIVSEDGERPTADTLLRQELTEHEIFKTLALTGNVTGPVIGVVPLDSHLSYKKLAKASGNKKVGMIPLKNLEATTGYVHGANNPVGIWQTKKFPIYFDQEARNLGVIVVSSGELGRSIRIEAAALAAFVEGQFVDIQETDGE